MKQLLIGLFAAFLTLAATDAAHAGPIVAAAAAIGSFITGLGVVGQVLVSAALSMGLSLLQAAIAKKKLKNQRDPGVQLEVEMADSSPIGFTIGRTATAGTRRYIGAWGEDGGTPNAYLTDAIQYGDIPNPGQPALWVDGKKVTILWSETPTDKGYPVEEFRVNGKDHLWVRYHDGTQVVSDDLLTAKFGSHPTRPWTSSHIGRGCPYIVITALVNRELFTGQINYLIEPPVARWYDLRKDTTAGGSGSHRWNDQSTWEATENPAVLIYNLIRGVYFGSEWVFGGRNLAAFRLPAANWMAAANACDVQIDLAGGGTEAAYRAGTEIRGDMEPLAIIEELRKACAGRLAEVGGVFKLLVGAPGSAVYSFTDGDVLVTKGQSITPFPGIENTYNGVEATYPEPLEMWKSKDAPARYDDDLEEEDGDRRLAVSIQFPAVPYGTQVQRLMHHYWLDNRRFIQHSLCLPPDAYGLEPNDVVEWTSAANGYSLAKFIVLRKDGEMTTNQVVHLREIDIGDADWSDDLELPTSVGPIGQEAVPPQPMTGWQAFPEFLEGDDSEKQKPSIRVQFAANLDDVSDVQVQVRRKATGLIVFDAPTSYAGVPGDPKAVILNGVFEPNTVYEVRGKFLPFSTRRTLWSNETLDGDAIVDGAWLEVTTPATTEDAIYAVVRERSTALLATIDEQVKRLAQIVAEQDASSFTERQNLTRDIRVQVGNARAFFTEQVEVLAGADAAMATQISNLGAALTTLDNELSAEISTQNTTLTNAINAVASSVTTLSASFDTLSGTVGSHTGSIATINSSLSTLATENASQSTAITNLATDLGAAESSIVTQSASISTLESAIAALFVDLIASDGEGSAEVLFRASAIASEDLEEALAGVEWLVRTGFGSGVWAEAAFRMFALYSAELGYHTRMSLKADAIDLEIDGATLPAKGLRVAGVVNVPIVSGTVEPDLTSKRRACFTTLTSNVTVKFPLGVEPGDDFIWTFKQDGTGGRTITLDTDGYLLPSVVPAVDSAANSYTVMRCSVASVSPPIASLVYEQGGAYVPGAMHVFSISPPVGGKTLINLDEGDLVLDGPGTWTITRINDRIDCDALLIGAGGSSGGAHLGNLFSGGTAYPGNPAAGTASTFATLTANAGAPSNGAHYNTGANVSGTGGAGGTASGGTNTTGNAGGNATGDGSPAVSGAGAAAPSGGASQPGVTQSGTGNANGVAGNSPGGGASGGVSNGINAGFGYAQAGGGGSGGRVTYQFSSSSGNKLDGGPYTVTLGAPGAVPAYNKAQGAIGGHARLVLSKIP